MPVESFNRLLEGWIKELDRYSLSQLLVKPDAGWSLGQLYLHLTEATGYFLKEAETCTSGNDNIHGKKFPAAEKMFSDNDFPDLLLEGPPSNAKTPQPVDKEQILNGLIDLQKRFAEVAAHVEKNPGSSKTKHFGLGYFSAGEWLQFAEMHMRHHLRQKKRLEEFLKEKSIG
ncbi:MAG TPA: DinB family protein [Chitinophagaceae bacterium]|nr:DinB family protein [Chitinophagaceae bacterium]